MTVSWLNLLRVFAASVVLFGLLVSGQTDCEWNCGLLDGQALQTFSDFTGPGGDAGLKTEVAKLDTTTGDYVSHTSYPRLHWINAAVYWRDNLTTPGVSMDKVFAVESHEFGNSSNPNRINYLVQLCPQDDTFIYRAVLPNRVNNERYTVASTTNNGTMWLSSDGNTDLVNVDIGSIYTTFLGTPSELDTSTYTSFDMDTDDTVADLAWYDPCEVFVGLSESSTLGELKVVLFDYDNDNSTTHTFTVDGPEIDHQGYGACYTFLEGDAVMCSGNGDFDNDIDGALYEINMDRETCLPTSVDFRVASRSSTATDGTTCRYPGTLPCVPAYVTPDADVCSLSRTMGANQPSAGGSGEWTVVSNGFDTLTASQLSFNSSDPRTVVTATQTGNVTLRWTLSAPVCTDSSADIVITFGAGCCAEDEYVNSNHACRSCPGATVSPPGADPEGDATQCIWPICPAHAVFLSNEWRCKCVTGYTGDPVWTGASYTNSCRKICKFCTNR